ncbi:hypothetical protein [Nonomuraea ceibae]|uniref:hypothetical protein n=1 Tax=Nonomuraea ceibae TaxID=1935170 RepID=UPI001C5DD55A|nr:hypothetical protein [Nonomuraea ceibae]
MSSRSRGPGGPAAFPATARPARLLVSLRTCLEDLHLPSCLVFRRGVPHLLIGQAVALVRVMSPGLFVHLPGSASSPAAQHTITAASLPAAAWELSELVNQALVTGLPPGRQAVLAPLPRDPAPYAVMADHAPEGSALTAVSAREEMTGAVRAHLNGALGLDDLTAARLPNAERASAAYDMAVCLKHLIAARGPTNVMPVNPWVAMAELADKTIAFTDGAGICWISARRSATGRPLIAYAATAASAAHRLLQTGERASHLPSQAGGPMHARHARPT